MKGKRACNGGEPRGQLVQASKLLPAPLECIYSSAGGVGLRAVCSSIVVYFWLTLFYSKRSQAAGKRLKVCPIVVCISHEFEASIRLQVSGGNVESKRRGRGTRRERMRRSQSRRSHAELRAEFVYVFMRE